MLMYIILLILLCATFLLLGTKNPKKLNRFVKILNRDVRLFGKVSVGIYHFLRHMIRQDTVAKIFANHAKKHPNKVAFYFQDQKWTFQDVEAFSNKIANYFRNGGYERGDNVALFMEACPEYVCVWLGLSKIGVVTALINSNLASDSLMHCIKATEPKTVIYGSTLKDAIRNISEKIPNMSLYQLNDDNQKSQVLDNATDLRNELKTESDSSPAEDLQRGKIKDRLIYIYTSGTTGLPKAVILKNLKYILLSIGMHYGLSLKRDDIVYNCLPLYHSMGGMLGIGHCLVTGGTVAISKKFSASNFWKECTKYNCNVALYIGELCRYLLAAHKNDTNLVKHSVTKMIGSGLKPKIWSSFESKFGIKVIFELYGSTEGNTNIVNFDCTPGAVGFCPFWAKPIYPVELVKCDMETAEPIRGSDGFCERCKVGEAGLFVGKVSLKTTMVEFSGYTDRAATEKKLLRDVFGNGDVYFNSGDILVKDDMGYFYFRDRTGDTYRWKGENVSTAEVEAVISNLLNLNDAVVYGVEIPDTDGKAGMAAIVHDPETLDMGKFYKSMKDNLPSYAIPRFLRIVPSISLTGTFKIQKTQLQKDSFHAENIKDKLFVYDAKNATYVELTKEKYDDVMSGKMKL